MWFWANRKHTTRETERESYVEAEEDEVDPRVLTDPGDGAVQPVLAEVRRIFLDLVGGTPENVDPPSIRLPSGSSGAEAAVGKRDSAIVLLLILVPDRIGSRWPPSPRSVRPKSTSSEPPREKRAFHAGWAGRGRPSGGARGQPRVARGGQRGQCPEMTLSCCRRIGNTNRLPQSRRPPIRQVMSGCRPLQAARVS
jgi:hypothetical protein